MRKRKLKKARARIDRTRIVGKSARNSGSAAGIAKMHEINRNASHRPAGARIAA